MLQETMVHRIAKYRLRAAERFDVSPRQCHIGHILIEAFLDAPLRLHQIDGATDTSETNASMMLRSMRLADAMRKSGLQPGDCVVITGTNILDLAVPFYAAHYNGYSLCCIDPGQAIEEIQTVCDKAAPKIIFTQNSTVGKVQKAMMAADHDATVVVFDDKTNDLSTFIEKHKGSEVGYKPAVDFDAADVPAWFILSSGTTGKPKLTAFTYKNLLNAVTEWWTLVKTKLNMFMTLATLQWISALMFFVSAPIKGFIRLQASVPASPQIIVKLNLKYRPDFTAWTPYILAQFVRSTAAGVAVDLSNFKLIMVAGAAIEKRIVDQFRKICPSTLMFSYGMTELVVPVFDNDPATTPPGSSGKPFTDKYEYRLVAENGEIIQTNHKPGVLWIKGDAFFKEFHNDPKETRRVRIEDGWFNTEDMFYRDENNYFYFVERRKVLVRYFSDWVSPLRIEELIKEHPGVAEACVVGIPNPDTIELAVGAILLKPNTTINAQEIFDSIDACLPDKSQLHGGVFFVESFPVTPSGKINRSKVIELALTADRILPDRK